MFHIIGIPVKNIANNNSYLVHLGGSKEVLKEDKLNEDQLICLTAFYIDKRTNDFKNIFVNFDNLTSIWL